MSLEKGKSRKVIGHNIKEMEASGHPRAQAIAASLSEARKSGAKIAKKGEKEMRNPKRSELVSQSQPFGFVRDQPVHPSSMPDYPIDPKALGPILNNGVNELDHAPKTPDLALAARDRASEHHDHPLLGWAPQG